MEDKAIFIGVMLPAIAASALADVSAREDIPKARIVRTWVLERMIADGLILHAPEPKKRRRAQRS